MILQSQVWPVAHGLVPVLCLQLRSQGPGQDFQWSAKGRALTISLLTFPVPAFACFDNNSWRHSQWMVALWFSPTDLTFMLSVLTVYCQLSAELLQYPKIHLAGLLGMLLVVVATAVCSQFVLQCGTWQVRCLPWVGSCTCTCKPVSYAFECCIRS